MLTVGRSARDLLRKKIARMPLLGSQRSMGPMLRALVYNSSTGSMMLCRGQEIPTRGGTIVTPLWPTVLEKGCFALFEFIH